MNDDTKELVRYVAGAMVGFGLGILLAVGVFLFKGGM